MLSCVDCGAVLCGVVRYGEVCELVCGAMQHYVMPCGVALGTKCGGIVGCCLMWCGVGVVRWGVMRCGVLLCNSVCCLMAEVVQCRPV